MIRIDNKHQVNINEEHNKLATFMDPRDQVLLHLFDFKIQLSSQSSTNRYLYIYQGMQHANKRNLSILRPTNSCTR